MNYFLQEGYTMNNNIIRILFDTIENRKNSSPEKSYTAKLYNSGTEIINEKILEEAGEVCEAGLENDKEHLINEICDLLYHTFVLAGYKNIKLEEIEDELARRHGISGIEEKNRRKKDESVG